MKNERPGLNARSPCSLSSADGGESPLLLEFAFCTVSTGVWKAPKKSVLTHLTYFRLIVRLQMVRHFLKVWDRAGDSQSGLKYSKEQIL